MLQSDWRGRTVVHGVTGGVRGTEARERLCWSGGDDTRQESDLYLICPDPGSCQHYHQHQPWYHTRAMG